MEAEITIARGTDRVDFLELWGDFLLAHEKLGSDMRATDRTLGFFASLFDSYVSRELIGFPLLARVDGEAVGVLLWGGLPVAPFDRTEDSVVNGWGAYTKPEHRRKGISLALRERAIMELDVAGIKLALGSALISNKPGIESSRVIGFEATILAGHIDIEEEAGKIRFRREFGEGHGALTDGFYWEGLCPLCGKE